MSNQLVKPQETGLSIFTSEEFGQVRVVMRDGEPWFVASDVAKALGYANPQEATRDHCKKVNKITQPSESLGSTKTPPARINIIPESDVYRLIMRSNLPNAERFQDWVVEEVLPSLRKTGKYDMTTPSLPFNQPDFTNPEEIVLAWADAARAWVDEHRKVAVLTETVEAQEIALSLHRDWKTVAGIPWFKEYFKATDVQALGRVGKLLTALCKREGIKFKSVPDDRWGKVNTYPVHAIDLLKKTLDEMPSALADIRKK